MLPSLYNLKREMVLRYETSINFHQATGRYIAGDSNNHSHSNSHSRSHSDERTFVYYLWKDYFFLNMCAVSDSKILIKK